MFEHIIYFAYDFNINVNEALVRDLEGTTACAYITVVGNAMMTV